ncbi:MAG TPA: putative toxin-antitoxin system toxin component, PIN family [Planctomycetales bacterium]|jgi:putative PIN family toxin of toxin-antitoxin system|nr:putative toxin-antitoxin system toxin component, PIN family [Planctomycetales bacterium]
MSSKPGYVFDTNVTISAALFEQSPPGLALHAALRGGELLISPASVAELGEVLGRKKFNRYLTREERQEFLVRLLRKAVVVEITEEIRTYRDAKDDKFLETAVCGRASCVVTGDADLLTLHPFRAIPILSPAQFLDMLARQ